MGKLTIGMRRQFTEKTVQTARKMFNFTIYERNKNHNGYNFSVSWQRCERMVKARVGLY